MLSLQPAGAALSLLRSVRGSRHSHGEHGRAARNADQSVTPGDRHFQWGSRTARIVYACHADALAVLNDAGDRVINWDALCCAAEAQRARYGALPAFVSGYLDGALCMIWQRIGWDEAILLDSANGCQWVCCDEPDWWEDWPTFLGEPRDQSAYAPLFPLEIAW